MPNAASALSGTWPSSDVTMTSAPLYCTATELRVVASRISPAWMLLVTKATPSTMAIETAM
jgi:hypothetical protein